MSRTTRHLKCRPEEVFAVLADGWTYASWVVGAARIRDVDADWPAVGSRIHHSVGLWPALINDTTSVEGADGPRELLLRVRAWPAGDGRVRLRCEADPDGGTTVTMEEWAVSGPATLVPTAVQDPALHARNTEALRRLAYLAEGGAGRVLR
ncbi:MAG TPA: SRPBCC family protein [Pedococcus sp.]|jgi:hypothetical protein